MYIRVIAILLIALSIFTSGYKVGGDSVQHEFDKYVNEARLETIRLNEEYRKLEIRHKNIESNLLEEMNTRKLEYDKNLYIINDDFNNRLLKQTERANYYRQQAKDSGCGQSNLADHTARLDTSLEEGRHLVRQLSETIRLRESELKLLGDVIINDRKTLNGN